MASIKRNYDSTGALQSSQIIQKENVVPEENLDISNWWTAFQHNSFLANCEADCLQHIFTRLAFENSIDDGLFLGFTCRRLYYYFKESQKVIRALKITIDNLRLLIRYGEIPSKMKSHMISNFCNVASKFATTFISLRSLNLMSINLNPNNLATLLTQLNALPLLTELNLGIRELEFPCKKTYKLLDFLWCPLAQLQPHPSLRILTINLIDRIFLTQHGLTPKDQYVIPPLPILRQLTSFTFVDNEPQFSLHCKVIQALKKEKHGVHLTPGVGARIELTFFQDDYFKVVSIEPVVLPFISFLDVTLGCRNKYISTNYEPAMASLFRCLPQMCNLKKIKLYLGENMKSTDYPSFLNAASSLKQLQELFIEINWSIFSWSYNDEPGYFPNSVRFPTNIPVLSSVRYLSLVFKSIDHADVVEEFHLAHCFPKLRQLRCRFEHEPIKEKLEIDNSQYRICGQKLARGVMELMPKTIVKKIEFKFDRYIPYYFSSLEDLMAYTKEKQQLWSMPSPFFPNPNMPSPFFPNPNMPSPFFPNPNMPSPFFPNSNMPSPFFPNPNSSELSSLRLKCAELKAENERLKRQLAQTELALPKHKILRS